MRLLARPLATTIAALVASAPIFVAVGAPAEAATLTATRSATVLHVISATPAAVATAGNGARQGTIFIVDATAPELAILTPANETATRDSTPEITGTSDVISGTVTVAIDDGPEITVPTNATGDWTLTSPRLTDGQHSAVARAVDAGGSTETGPANFLVDATPPVFAITTPVNGSTTKDPTPPITGTFDFGINPGGSHFGTITVTIDGGAPITLKNNNVTGEWALTPTTALDDGVHVIVARGADFVDNSSTDTSRFTVAATASPGPLSGTGTDSAATRSVPPGLANTGSESVLLVAIALLLLLMGTAVGRISGIKP